LRGGFACAWCEIKADRLLLLAHPNSGRATRQFAYPQEADIVGPVTRSSFKLLEHPRTPDHEDDAPESHHLLPSLRQETET
jgi:hypothetical protein